MRRATNAGGRSAESRRARPPKGHLDRARIEARLGFRPSVIDDTPERDGFTLRDGAIAVAFCIAASGALIAPELDHDTRVALSLRHHLDSAGAIETATVPVAVPAGVAAIVRAERGSTPFWAEAKMDRAGPARPLETAVAPIPEEIVVGGPMPATPTGRMIVAAAPEALGEIVTGVVLDGPIDAGNAIAAADGLPTPLEGPLTFPTASIDDLGPFAPRDGAPLQPMPLFRPGQNPFELDRGQREELGFLETGAVSLRAPRSAPPAAALQNGAVQPLPQPARAAPPRSTPEAIARAALGGGLFIEELARAYDALEADDALASLLDDSLASISPPQDDAAENMADFAPLAAAAVDAAPVLDPEAAADIGVAANGVADPASDIALETDMPALVIEAVARAADVTGPDAAAPETQAQAAVPQDESQATQAVDPRDIDQTLAVAFHSLSAAGASDAMASNAVEAPDAFETASIPDATPAIDPDALTQAAINGASAVAPLFAPRAIPDPRTAVALRADRLAGVAPEASPAARPRPAAAVAAETFFEPPKPRPTITIVLTALGLNTEASKVALEKMPREVAISIAPIAVESAAWSQRADAAGHVVLAETPMEPEAYPRVNPGPLTLLTTSSVDENIRRLGETLDRVPHADGVATYLGGRFAKNDTAAAMFAAAIERRGLMLLETVPEPGRKLVSMAARAGVPVFASAVSIDSSGHDRSVAAGLKKLEEAARRDGYAIGVGVTIPTTVAGVARWIETLDERGFDLVALGPAAAPAAVAQMAD